VTSKILQIHLPGSKAKMSLSARACFRGLRNTQATRAVAQRLFSAQPPLHEEGDSLVRLSGGGVSRVIRPSNTRQSVSGIVATVFGASGFVGHHVVQHLGEVGAQVIVPYRGDGVQTKELRVMGDLGQVVPMAFDMRDVASIKRVLSRSNVVINLIGSHRDTIHYKMHDTNVKCAHRIAKLAKEAGVERFVHVSALGAGAVPATRKATLVAMPHNKALPEGPAKDENTMLSDVMAPIQELKEALIHHKRALQLEFMRFVLANETRTDAGHDSLFLKSKFESEEAVKAFYPEATILRPAPIFGGNDRLLNTLGEAVDTCRFFLPVTYYGTQKLAPVDVDDVAAAVINSILDDGSRGKTYELAGPDTVSLHQLLCWIMYEVHLQKPIVNLPPAVAEAAYKILEKIPRVVSFNREYFRQQKYDLVPQADALTLKDLGITAATMYKEGPNHLMPYRRNRGEESQGITYVARHQNQ